MSMIDRIVHLSFELSSKCNLARQHTWCPASVRDGGILSGDEIIGCIAEAKRAGFCGYVGFHYYNEPLLNFDVIRYVADKGAYSNLMLWTNGLLLEPHHVPYFKWIVVTNYPADTGIDMAPKVESLKKQFPETQFSLIADNHDTRMGIYKNQKTKERVCCWRPLIEIPIDCEGNVHLCCQDWYGEVHLGNIRQHSLYEILTSRIYQTTVYALACGKEVVPEVCKRCVHQLPMEVYDSYAKSAGLPLSTSKSKGEPPGKENLPCLG